MLTWSFVVAVTITPAIAGWWLPGAPGHTTTGEMILDPMCGSGTLVIDTLTAGGRTDTSLRQKLVWLLALAGIGIALLLSGGLNSLQAGSVATGLPLAALLLLMAVGTLRGLLALRRRETTAR